MDNPKPRKMKKKNDEMKTAFITRLIDYSEQPLTVQMVMNRINKRSWKPTESQVRTALKLAVRHGGVKQKRDVHYKRIVYYSDVTPLQAMNIYEDVDAVDTNNEIFEADAVTLVRHCATMDGNKTVNVEIGNVDSKKQTPTGERPTITGLVAVTMDANAFVENLYRLDRKLYESVLDSIGDSIGVGGTWGRDNNGNMVYEVSI